MDSVLVSALLKNQTSRDFLQNMRRSRLVVGKRKPKAATLGKNRPQLILKGKSPWPFQVIFVQGARDEKNMDGMTPKSTIPSCGFLYPGIPQFIPTFRAGTPKSNSQTTQQLGGKGVTSLPTGFASNEYEGTERLRSFRRIGGMSPKELHPKHQPTSPFAGNPSASFLSFFFRWGGKAKRLPGRI